MPPARDLPGFYYDAEKNRYFPVSSQGRSNQPKSQAIQGKLSHVKNEIKDSPNVDAKLLQILSDREIGNACTSSMFKQRCLEANASKPWLGLYGATSSADGAVEEFDAQIQTSEGLKGANMITWGNSKGDVGVCEVRQGGLASNGFAFPDPEHIFPPSDVPMLIDASCPPSLIPISISRISNSKITIIKKLKNKEGDRGRLILTTLGSGVEGGALHLLEQKQDLGSFSFDSVKHAITDSSVWTAAYCGPDRATLGTSKGAALVHLETSSLRWFIHSKSDILSQECDLLGNLVFCGFRNGYISMVDMRSPLSMPRRMPLMHSRHESCTSQLSSKLRNNLSRRAAQDYVHARKKRTPFRDKAAKIAKSFCETMRMNSAVCSLVLLRSDESYLLASAMNGDIYLWDRRLIGRGPVLTYEGNQNSHLPLHLGVDSSESLVASGGEDSAVRIWSLRSGQLLRTISKLPAIVHNFNTPDPNSCFMENTMKAGHAWGIWLGSSAGVMYMHG